jgi:beta-alanine degradation protein BauB
MKKIILTLLSGMLLLCPFTNLHAQDMVKTDPVHCKLLNDTLGVSLIQVSLKPGEKLPMHIHPTWMFYVLTDGTLRHYEMDGTYFDAPLKVGMHLQGKTTTVHSDENVGDKPIEFLLVEIKK